MRGRRITSSGGQTRRKGKSYGKAGRPNSQSGNIFLGKERKSGTQTKTKKVVKVMTLFFTEKYDNDDNTGKDAYNILFADDVMLTGQE